LLKIWKNFYSSLPGHTAHGKGSKRERIWADRLVFPQKLSLIILGLTVSIGGKNSKQQARKAFGIITSKKMRNEVRFNYMSHLLKTILLKI